MTRQRQPKGIPVGGQFAAERHDEAHGTLATLDDDQDWGTTGVHEGSRSPWGRCDWVEHPAPGISVVYAPGHGGIKVSPERNKVIPAPLRNRGGWYEEDCEASIVGMYHPEAFPHLDGDYDHASSVKQWFPDAYEKATGETVTADESHVRAEAEWQQIHAGKWQVVGAGRSDDEAGMVEVSLQRVGHAYEAGAECRNVLVPTGEYDMYGNGTNAHGKFPGKFLVADDEIGDRYRDVTPPPAPPSPPEPTFHGIDSSGLTDRQQSLVRRDLRTRWRADDGSVQSLEEVIREEGLTAKSVIVENGKRVYYLSTAAGHAYTVTKATWSAVEAPDRRSESQRARCDLDVARARMDYFGFDGWRRDRNEYDKAKAAYEKADEKYRAALEHEKQTGT